MPKGRPTTGFETTLRTRLPVAEQSSYRPGHGRERGAMKGGRRAFASPVLIGLLVFAAMAPTAGAFRGQQVYAIGNCKSSEVRPSKIIFTCADGNYYATGIRYRSYGGAVAVAQATLHRNTCEPNCAQGHFVSTRATVRLFAIKRCAGRYFYTSASASTTPRITWQVGYPKRCGRALT
jgi:hypothetical protein